jgi:hypothetical protein
MKKQIQLMFFMIALCACDEDVEVADVLFNLKISDTQIVADGQSTVRISVNIPDRSTPDRRNVIFTTTAGVFTSSSAGKYTAKTEFLDGVLTATATLRAPTSPGKIAVSVQPEFDSPIKEFIVADTIEAVRSNPSTILLETSSFGISPNFLTEVKLTGLLKNSKGNNVSKNVKVLFEDILLDGRAANGRHRELQSLSNDTSYVSSYYSVPAYPIGTTVKIRATVLDDIGIKTLIKDSLIVTVNQ